MNRGSSTLANIELNNVSKKFGTVWIFKNFSAGFSAGKKYAIVGANGSGKSTLLKIIGGIITPNSGNVTFSGLNIPDELVFCAPFMELPEELTLEELLNFHTHLRELNISKEAFIREMEIEPTKEIRHYSSGMKQRVKLALAFYSKSKVVLLDEPTSNLDEHWSNWYLQMIKNTTTDKLVVISSNIAAEYNFCDTVFNISDHQR